MHLHVETSGTGKPLVMLHGWGMHGGIWGEAAERLAQRFQVHRVDLPGHGLSAGRRAPAGFSLDAAVAMLTAGFDEPVSVLGWSLGGMIAQHWAVRHPQQVERLILVASTPCFARRPDWEHGMPHETLAQFAAELEKNFSATLRRFLALQVRGSEGERELLVELRERLFSRGEPELDALRSGLHILMDADLRNDLAQIGQPALVMAGERDKLTPPQAAHYMARMMPSATMVELKGAAHAPFLSHRDEFVGWVTDFMEDGSAKCRG